MGNFHKIISEKIMKSFFSDRLLSCLQQIRRGGKNYFVGNDFVIFLVAALPR
jgi:hypothetical protein